MIGIALTQFSMLSGFMFGPPADLPSAVNPASAITSPSPGETLTVGTLFSVTGTSTEVLSPVSSVSVYLGNPYAGGALLGTATGTAEWSYGFTPSGGQVGARAIYALATDSEGRTGLSSGVAVTIQSNPSVDLPTSYSGLLGWYGASGTSNPNVTATSYRSNNLSTSAQYAAANATVTAGQPDHLGGNTAFLITETGAGSIQHYIRTTGVGDTGTFYAGDQSISFYAKQNVGTRGVCQNINSTTGGVTANLALNTTVTGAVYADTAASSAAGGWTKFQSIIANAITGNNHIGLSGNLTSMAAYTAGEVGSMFISLGPEGHCSQTRISQATDNSGNLRHAARLAGSETLQPFAVVSPNGTGTWMGSIGTTLKSFALPAGIYSNMQGSFTLGMRCNIFDITGNTPFIDTSSTTPKLKIDRNLGIIRITRTQDDGTTSTVNVITGLTVGVHDVWITYDNATGTVTGYLDGVAKTPVTSTTGACTFGSMLMQFNVAQISEMVMFNSVKNTTEIEAMRIGMGTRKGVIA